MTDTIAHATAEIALSKLDPSPANVRRTGTGLGVEALAASIAAHGLLQSLAVRAKRDGAGRETGRYEVVAGGRRLAALRLLAKGKRLAKHAPIPCRVLDGADDAEASLAENTVRLDMHPADQFEAFAALHRGGEGLGVEEIAARFGVSAHTVRQRLRLAAVSPALVQAYRDEVLTLDHLMAFAVTEDREAQERVFAQLPAWQRSPDTIRRLLTNALVPATDRRVLLVGLDAYLAAGGRVQRDLFAEDGGGWIEDAALLERLVAERMEREAEAVRAEGWAWVAIGPEAQSQAWRCRRVWPAQVPLSAEDEARRAVLAARYDDLAAEHGSSDDLPEAVAAELDRIEAELDALDARERAFQPEDMAVAGAVVTLASDGTLRVERGYVRPEDEPKPDADEGGEAGAEAAGGVDPADRAEGGPAVGGGALPEPEDKAPALSAALQGELEAHRTAGLQAELAAQPDLALRVLLHGLATDAFYARYADTVARFSAHPPALAAACPGIADSPARQAVAAAEATWRGRLPDTQADLWPWLMAQDTAALLGLLAVCVARVADAGRDDWTTPRGAASIGGRVAEAAGLDMRRWWGVTAEGYLARVPKALILEAVREGAGGDAAHRLRDVKEAMVRDAAALLDGKGWLPRALRVPGTAVAGNAATNEAAEAGPAPLPCKAEPPALPQAAE
ncbi:ParB/RepB/Spo0J family partition protein [Roseomonas sp. NAR14]|uniref:ParB/RepB/Spo0J family partition protein n=1 Tax=Roseomonas acroporae TaxID=2937791 RepID=A0A9X1YCZ7_9PROT|nr:ParB/RepB/Spo0J family partition protein [Roseomonas acroporae]MCK8788154.1 ParB/RepB/Spo0J family partition protein [Roseomonas acroporae]